MFSRMTAWAILVGVIVALGFHFCRKAGGRRETPAGGGDGKLVLVTGYCNCGKCCGWKRSWFGFGSPVYDYGPMKGRPKKVGVTATGTRAHHGTIAADPKVFKMGTRLNVPGYGVGTVEDVGGAIKDKHIDIWFPTHEAALKWGRKWLSVTEVGEEAK